MLNTRCHFSSRVTKGGQVPRSLDYITQYLRSKINNGSYILLILIRGTVPLTNNTVLNTRCHFSSRVTKGGQVPRSLDYITQYLRSKINNGSYILLILIRGTVPFCDHVPVSTRIRPDPTRCDPTPPSRYPSNVIPQYTRSLFHYVRIPNHMH